MSWVVPKGFEVAGVYSGVKLNPNSKDLTLIVTDTPAVAAGVYTQNRVFAAPVAVDRARTPSDDIRAVVVNSGNANACTGEQGMTDALDMARLAAAVCGADPEQSLVLSTGIIGELMPMDKIAAGIALAGEQLNSDEASLLDAARGIITTDLAEKLAARQLQIGGRTIQITGIAKGSGMIGPNMATMLGVVMTDARLTAADAQTVLAAVADDTFNCISVEGHTSTNDTVLLLASGAAGGEPLAGADLTAFGESLHEVCVELARAIPDDGEGATHLIEIEVHGCGSVDDARLIAKTIANSALVKTAVAGADPNWGRIVSAAGYAGVAFDPATVDLHVNGTLLYEQGRPVPFDAAAVSDAMRGERETRIVLDLGQGTGRARFWTSDLTAEYVRINADYHT